MGVAMIGVAVLELESLDTLLVIAMMVFLAVYQWTLGTYSWVYLPAVACDEGLSLGTAVLWLTVFVISLTTNAMFSGLGSAGTFFFFAGGSLISALFFFIFLKETKGLSRDESQKLYSAELKYKVVDTIGVDEKGIGASTVESHSLMKNY